MSYSTQTQQGQELNRIYEDDLSIHEWYRFVLSYPPHIVREYVESFGLSSGDLILDPFCGTGTTLVECKKLGIDSVGFEANPVVHWAAKTKTDWSGDPDALEDEAETIAQNVTDALKSQGVDDDPLFSALDTRPENLKTLNKDQTKLLIKDSISPLPLHKSLVLRDAIEGSSGMTRQYMLLALAKHAVFSFSNLRFGPEVGVGKKKEDHPVVRPWLAGVKSMAQDLRDAGNGALATVHLNDSRLVKPKIKPGSVSAVITSPPYPNEKDYSRTTRLESVLLGFMKDRHDLRRIKETFLCSNTRNVYKALTEDAQTIQGTDSVTDLADEIDETRIRLGKTSGFEKLYGEVVRRYFGGMARHLEELKPLLAPGAQLAYVVGDQASYFRILIRTGELLAEVAEKLGYEVVRIDLFRTRLATATRAQLREEVVILRWPG